MWARKSPNRDGRSHIDQIHPISGSRMQGMMHKYWPSYGKHAGIRIETCGLSLTGGWLVELRGIEPLTSSLRTTRSPI